MSSTLLADQIIQESRIQNFINKFPQVYENLLSNFDLSSSIGTVSKWDTVSQKDNHGNTIICSIPSSGYVIDTPGNYIFVQDITWEPAIADTPAIRIIANNVVLDLKHHNLLCVDNRTPTLKTVGILVTDAVNVVIKNGTISNMGLIGIKSEFCKNVTVKNIIVDGLTTNDIISIPLVVPVGIYFNLCLYPTCVKSTVRNLDVRVGTMAGIQFTLCFHSKTDGCRVKNLINRDGACTGVGHALCLDVSIKNTKITNLQSFFNGNLNTQGHTCIGFIPVLSADIHIENCHVSDIKGCCDDAHGMSMFITEDVKIINSTVNNVVDGLGDNTGAKATGIELYAYNVKVVNCKATNIKAIVPQDLQAAGFSTAGGFVEYINCSAKNVKVCDASGKSNTDVGYGVGFGWAPDPRPLFVDILADRVSYKNCSSYSCQVGFDTWNHTNSTWEWFSLKKKTSKCSDIFILKGSTRTLRCNPCSECNPPIITTITDQSANNKFFL